MPVRTPVRGFVTQIFLTTVGSVGGGAVVGGAVVNDTQVGSLYLTTTVVKLGNVPPIRYLCPSVPHHVVSTVVVGGAVVGGAVVGGAVVVSASVHVGSLARIKTTNGKLVVDAYLLPSRHHVVPGGVVGGAVVAGGAVVKAGPHSSSFNSFV